MTCPRCLGTGKEIYDKRFGHITSLLAVPGNKIEVCKFCGGTGKIYGDV